VRGDAPVVETAQHARVNVPAVEGAAARAQEGNGPLQELLQHRRRVALGGEEHAGIVQGQQAGFTVPLLTPTTFFVFLITVISVLFGSFDIVNVMTQGGPLNATNTFIYTIYQNAFQYFQLGYASAQAYLLFVVVFAFTMLNWRLQKKWVHY